MGVGREPFSELCGKALVIFADDRRVLTHFAPIVAELKELAREVVVVAPSSGRLPDIEALGVRAVDFDCRPVGNPARRAPAAWELAHILEAEAPDVVHLVGLEPVLLGGLALKLVATPAVVVHFPRIDWLIDAPEGRFPAVKRRGALWLAGSMLRKPGSCLLVDNAEDLAALRKRGINPAGRFAILGGPGIDPEAYPPLQQPVNAAPLAAFVGDATRANGVDVLMRAYDRCRETGTRMQLQICGTIDETDADTLPPWRLTDWCARNGARWLGWVDDVREVWREADICVLPSRRGGPVPRALLEAAASARALVVTDVPGNRTFVRDGVEGYVVPTGDFEALADVLKRLAADRDLRLRLGEAARLRVKQGFTEADVRRALRAAYLALLGKAPLL